MEAALEAFQMLMREGLPEERAARSALSQRGPLYNAGASHMNQAFRKAILINSDLLQEAGFR